MRSPLRRTESCLNVYPQAEGLIMVDVLKREDFLLDTIAELIRKRDNAIAYAQEGIWCAEDQDEIVLLIDNLR
jgi:hypothetical protein